MCEFTLLFPAEYHKRVDGQVTPLSRKVKLPSKITTGFILRIGLQFVCKACPVHDDEHQ